jgi:hypothetical protein
MCSKCEAAALYFFRHEDELTFSCRGHVRELGRAGNQWKAVDAMKGELLASLREGARLRRETK